MIYLSNGVHPLRSWLRGTDPGEFTEFKDWLSAVQIDLSEYQAEMFLIREGLE